jgi:outer membrane protein assembly factor BamB
LAVFVLAALGAGIPASGAGDSDWNQWRGPKRDGLSPDTGLLKAWPTGGPPLAWKATGIGGGFSSVSVQGDRIFTMGDVGEDCNVIALGLDGKILWSTKLAGASAPKDQGGYPGPRCTPATDGTLVFALGAFGDLICVQRADGKEVWRKNLGKDFGGRVMSGWGFSESPLLDGDNLICTPGGSNGTVLALKKATGEKVWQSSELTDRAAYASLVPVEIGGVRQYLILTDASVAGIAAADGKVVWRAKRSGKTAVIPDPIYKDGIVFVTSGYGVGCNGFKVTAAGGKFSAEEVYSGGQLENHHGGVILVGDHLYELDNKGGLKCAEIATGKVVWEDKSVGKGSIAYADGHLIVRSERQKTGTIALVEATPTGYKETGRFDQPNLSGKQTWPHPVVFGGKLYIRDQDVLLCYDVKAK